MGRPIYKLTGRSRMRRPWWAPWSKREEFEVYMVFWSSGFFWYNRTQMLRYFPKLAEKLPE